MDIAQPIFCASTSENFHEKNTKETRTTLQWNIMLKTYLTISPDQKYLTRLNVSTLTFSTVEGTAIPRKHHPHKALQKYITILGQNTPKST